MSEQAHRDALAEVLATHATFDTRDKGWPCRWSCICGTVIREPQDSRHLPELHIVHVTDALLDWLAQRDRRVAAEALREAAEDLAPRPSSERPCDNPEDCCGSAAHCDAVRPMRRVVGESWLRERADRIEAGE